MGREGGITNEASEDFRTSLQKRCQGQDTENKEFQMLPISFPPLEQEFSEVVFAVLFLKCGLLDWTRKSWEADLLLNMLTGR